MRAQKPILCSLAFAFIVASISIVALIFKRRTQTRIFEGTLTQRERIVYDRVKKARRRQYMVVTLVGIIVALLAVILVYRTRARGEETLVHAGASLLCVFLATAFGVQFLLYMSWPRDEYLATTLEGEDKRKYWQATESQFQRWFYISFTVALLTSLLVNFIR